MRLTPDSRAPAKADPSARAGFEFDPGGLHLGRGCAYLGLGWRHLGGFSLAYVVTIVAFCRPMWPPSWHMRAICWSILAPILAQRSHSRVSRRTEIRRPRARYQRSFAWCCRCCCGCGRCCCRGHGCCCGCGCCCWCWPEAGLCGPELGLMPIHVAHSVAEVAPILAYVGAIFALCRPGLPPSWPMLALSWPMLSLSEPSLDPCGPHLGSCRPYVGTSSPPSSPYGPILAYVVPI